MEDEEGGAPANGSDHAGNNKSDSEGADSSDDSESEFVYEKLSGVEEKKEEKPQELSPADYFIQQVQKGSKHHKLYHT